jgi:[ribosomal protein S5]-alanine N-acetyltransferase
MNDSPPEGVVLETERLMLRRLTLRDAAFIRGLLNEPSFLRYIGDRGVRNDEQARAYLRDGPLASYEKNGYGLWLVVRKEDGAPLGLCGLLRRDALDAPDVGFALKPSYWRQGYAREAARAVLDYGRNTLGLHRIVAIVQPVNEASARLVETLGLRFEGLIRMGDEDLRLFATDP